MGRRISSGHVAEGGVMTGHDRIDVHSHVVPPFWAEQLDSYGGDHSGTRTPTWWTPDGAIAFMDSQNIASSILS
jgi:aminocarboxymuconate-semialdehyde decarboxylase